ncbi:MAG: hypothetical protein ACE5EX_03095, partial [Phycisphaerae bacterium]
VTLTERIDELLKFRSVDPLYGAFLARQLVRASFEEKLQALESVLPLPPAIERKVRLDEMAPGPLQLQVLQPSLIKAGLLIVTPDGGMRRVVEDAGADYWAEEVEPPPPTVAEMLKMLFESGLATPEAVFVQPKWVAGGVAALESDFHKYVRARDLVKNEGLILRHLLRLTILTGEFFAHGDDPDYEQIGELATRVCRSVDERYTDRFLESEREARSLAPV